MDAEDVVAAAERWLAQDPDPDHRAQVAELIARGDTGALRALFDGPPLGFGTSGIRAPAGPGPRHLNRAVVIRTAAGILRWLEDRGIDGPVVIGWDARRHSQRFAADLAGVLAAHGRRIVTFTAPAPTPLVVFAGTQLGAAATVVVTASHNPAVDHGIKVYGPDGVGVVPPDDAAIAAAAAAAPPATQVARIEVDHPAALPDTEVVGETLTAAYIDAVLALRPTLPTDRRLRIVTTPLHGVAGPLLRRVLEAAGYDHVVEVPEQAEPDPEFPTVPVPNPERAGVLDRALVLAAHLDADVVLATDPDGDRLAVAAPGADGWQALHGDDLGALLCEVVLADVAAGPPPLVVSTLVSGPLAVEIAAARGAVVERTLTGFRWIWHAALTLERTRGVRFVFGYEEALGYSLCHDVHDKDGLSAALVAADLAAYHRDAGATLWDALDDLQRRHRTWVSTQRLLPGAGAELLDRAATELADRLGAVEVTDHRRVGDVPAWRGPAPLVELTLPDGRLLVRPSGTEPALKIYTQVRVDAPEQRAEGRRRAAHLAETAAQLLSSRTAP